MSDLLSSSTLTQHVPRIVSKQRKESNESIRLSLNQVDTRYDRILGIIWECSEFTASIVSDDDLIALVRLDVSNRVVEVALLINIQLSGRTRGRTKDADIPGTVVFGRVRGSHGSFKRWTVSLQDLGNPLNRIETFVR